MVSPGVSVVQTRFCFAVKCLIMSECSSLIGQVVSSLNDDVVVDQRVLGVADSWWHSMLILPPLFKDSPASPFLSAYYPDCVGMSPSAAPGNQRPEQRRAAPPHSESVIHWPLTLMNRSTCFHDQLASLLRDLDFMMNKQTSVYFASPTRPLSE